MTKELEALKRIRQETCPATYMADFDKNECCDVIEQALNRLEAIDNVNPSEALKCLEEWYGFLMADNDTTYSNGYENEIEYNRRKEAIYKQYYIIKQALLKAQEQEKVLNEALKLNGEWAEELDYYKELEEQIGCPLDVIEKAIKNGIYTNVYSGICYVTRSDDYLLVSDDYDVRLSDYKKTWWLKEDKSE